MHSRLSCDKYPSLASRLFPPPLLSLVIQVLLPPIFLISFPPSLPAPLPSFLPPFFSFYILPPSLLSFLSSTCLSPFSLPSPSSLSYFLPLFSFSIPCHPSCLTSFLRSLFFIFTHVFLQYFLVFSDSFFFYCFVYFFCLSIHGFSLFALLAFFFFVLSYVLYFPLLLLLHRFILFVSVSLSS